MNNIIIIYKIASKKQNTLLGFFKPQEKQNKNKFMNTFFKLINILNYC